MGLHLSYEGARSAFVHEGVAKRMVVDFKAGGQPVLAPLMARLAAPAFGELVAAARSGASVDAPDVLPSRPPGVESVVVTWVATHARAQRERGYNQAELLARALAAGDAALTAAGLTRKPVRTRHQKELGRAGRLSNLEGAFVLDDQAVRRLASRAAAVILVDDVYTTGATCQEVSSVLARGLEAPVYVFTFSRALSSPREGHD